jgi:outer membrane immunogenic protein
MRQHLQLCFVATGNNLVFDVLNKSSQSIQTNEQEGLCTKDFGVKKILMATTLAAICVPVPAFAVDTDTAPFLMDWSGAYLGVHGGYGFGDQDWTLIDNPGGPNGEGGEDSVEGGGPPLGSIVASPSTDGMFGGIQAGYNWRTGRIVFGAEAEFSPSGIEGSESRIAGGDKPGPREWSSDMNWLGTVGPRLGYAFDSTLLYAEGGLAFANQDFFHLGAYGGPPQDPLPDPTPPGRTYDNSKTQFGWFIGAGLEQAFSDHWSGRVEYNYIDLGGEVKLWGNPQNPAVFDIDQNIHIIKVGLNYRFGM